MALARRRSKSDRILASIAARQRAHTSTTHGLWIGGHFRSPFYITVGEVYRPEIVVWLDAATGAVRAMEVARPGEIEASGVSSLRHALGASGDASVHPPRPGPAPTSPTRLRISDPALAAAARVVLGDAVQIALAPTPELAEVAAHLAAMPPPGEDVAPSYLHRGRVDRATVAALFESAVSLARIAPWSLAREGQVVWFAAPALAVDGGVLSIVGNPLDPGERHGPGFILFESLAGVEAMLELNENLRQGEMPATTVDPTMVLSLELVTRRRLGPDMAREVKTHGWKVSGAHGYPLLRVCDLDGVERPTVDRDVRIARAAADATGRFVAAHPTLFTSRRRPRSKSASYEIDGVGQVCITAPHPDLPWRGPDPA